MISVAEEQPPLSRSIACTCEFDRLTFTHERSTKTKLLGIALALLAGFFALELAVGYWSHSLALLADATHLLSDVGTLGLTLAATVLADQPAIKRATFGYRRVEILAALINGITLMAIAVFVAIEAIDRLQSPEPILVLPMLVGAGLGLAVNGLNILLLHKHSHSDLNLRGAFLHVVADAASSVGILLAALAVYAVGWDWMDATAGLAVAVLTGLSAIPLVKSSLEVLLEFAPADIDPIAVSAALNAFDGVEQVEKLHIWTVTSGQIMLCASLSVKAQSLAEQNRLLKALQAYLCEEFAVQNAVLQLANRQPDTAPLHPLFNQSLSSMSLRRHGS
jgi:cobalt-zinc-cadmium efflux system protein